MGLSSGMTRYQYIIGQGQQQDTAEDIYCQTFTQPHTWQCSSQRAPTCQPALMGRQRLEHGTGSTATLDVSGDLPGSPTQISDSPGKSMP